MFSSPGVSVCSAANQPAPLPNHTHAAQVLNAQDNQICTLKGSLPAFTNLEQLDLSGNQLRDLAKLLPVLQRFQLLKHLNLMVGVWSCRPHNPIRRRSHLMLNLESRG